MKIKALKKLMEKGTVVKIAPPPEYKTLNRQFEHNQWLIQSVLDENKIIEFSNVETNHAFRLGFDSYREFRNPDFIIVRSKILVEGSKVDVEPIISGVTSFAPANLPHRNLKAPRKLVNLSANPTYTNIERVILESDSHEDWNLLEDSVHSVASYKKDMNLRFEIRYMDDGVQCEDFREPWANRHPDPSATGYWCNLYYGSTLVKKFILVAVDGGRAMLPIPQRGRKDMRPDRVLPLYYKIAQIHDRLGTLKEYMSRSGLIFDEKGRR